jgi:hypothetical protein
MDLEDMYSSQRIMILLSFPSRGPVQVHLEEVDLQSARTS